MRKQMLLMSLFAILLSTSWVFGQGTTTSRIGGSVVDDSGQPLPGATVIAIHLPSGTQYGTATSNDGRFIIPGMRVGGPYKVTVSFLGYTSWEQDDINVNLGSQTPINVTLAETGIELETVIVVAKPGSVGQNTGTSTRVTSEQIEDLPSVNRDINDFLRLTPQSSGYSDGITFAGINNRYNAIYIDGAVNNDVYGLASSGTNGGQTGITPFSIDIIDQLQVVISPYDVTLGGFAGGGINAVTKSGTNTLKGSAYTYMRNQSMVGKTNGTYAERLDVERTRVDDFSEKVYGFSLGGPIIKDKLFFFGNVEIQRDETPRPFEVTDYTSTAGRVSTTDLDNLRNFLITNYDYDPGSYGSTTDDLNGLKIFGKLDYNFNENHRLTLRHQYTKAEQYDRNTGSSSTINFSNNGVYFPSITNSTALEVNSRFGLGYSNNLIVSYVTVRDDRDPIGSDFPYVYIDDVSFGSIRFGSEQYSTANELNQNILSITDNFNIYKGAHKITVGTHNEFYDLYNVFIAQNYGTYSYASLSDFLDNTNVAADEYDRSYSLVDDITGDGTAAAGDFKAIQLGFYVQDEWSVTDQLTVTGGLRLDIPVITTAPEVDDYFNETALPLMQDFYSVADGAEAGVAPDKQFMFSPRLGFSYDLKGDNTNVIRGGLGIFTSRIPFVWPGSIYTNNGLTLGRVNEGNIAGGAYFNPDISTQYVHPSPTLPAGQIDLFVKDFKYPQVFRTNLAYDFTLPWGIVSTVEGIFTKTLNNILYTNINNDPTIDFRWDADDDRPVYTRSSIDPTYSAVYLASNTSEGYSYNLTASFAKEFNFGLLATVAYSYNDAYALSEGTSSQNSSQWRGQVNIDGRNEPVFGRSDFAVGHRIISSVSYSHDWTKDGNNKTTVSLFLNAQSGSPYSYVIGGSSARNMNNETGSTSRNRSLIFVPETESQINLVDYTVGATTVTAAEQWANLEKFINDDPYLSEMKGKYAEKNGAWAPFSTILDVALRHDLGLNIGGNSHKFQISLDISNFGNMLNNKWGTRYSVPGDFNNYFLYEFDGYNGDTPEFTFREDKIGLEALDISNLSSRDRKSVV